MKSFIKNKKQRLAALLPLLLLTGFLSAQRLEPGKSEAFDQTVPEVSVVPYHEEHDRTRPCIAPEQERQMEERVAANRAALVQAGLLAERSELRSVVHPLLRWPLRAAGHFREWSFWYISNFLDSDPDDDQILDYNCGSRTYDGHRGIDIGIPPNGWNQMDAQVVDIVAAAPGIILDSHDGEYDRRCDWDGDYDANYVVLEHSDGSRTQYWHMKNGSVTNLPIGTAVKEGQYLGKVGSSGISTGPHLHFGVIDGDDNRIEPFQGSCNYFNDDTWWQNQRPYVDPAMLTMMTTKADISFQSCPNPHVLNEANHFSAGNIIKFYSWMRNSAVNDVVNSKVFRPDGTTQWNANYTETSANGILGLKYTYSLPANAAEGTWKWEITYKGVKYASYFTIGCPNSLIISGNLTGNRGYLSGASISSTAGVAGSSANNIVFEAEDGITLTPTFWAKTNAQFWARLDNCSLLNPLDDAGTDDRSAENTPEQTPVLSTELMAWPSPFSTRLEVSVRLDPTAGAAMLQLLDMTGRTMQAVPLQTDSYSGDFRTELHTEALAPGTYFLRMVQGDQVTTKKVVKM